MFNGSIIFLNGFVLYWSINMFIAALKQVVNIMNNGTSDDKIVLLAILLFSILLGAISIESIIGSARKIWSSRR